ncbi:leucine-rich repeat domain-containing protein [Chryseobacterium viscerum]|uniref:leucine-rich repeat domain-containing protein n=1 Tax=Chryseobacterium viscerum TaxID=1037377 RepID=UPI0022233695|nr:leucine-rich repeat domain-containing protein [Chryseobacterium viscerum]MCW1961917.1 leucine-rich repeat domain-containing protein [Chryseobacterium viscerum]
MNKPNDIRDFEILNKIELTETNSLVFDIREKEKKNIYKLDKNGNVIALNLCNNGFDKIQGLILFPDLEELYLNGNQLEYLFIRDFFPNLKVLHISDNLLNDDSIDFYYLDNLEELYLNNNKLTKIPQSTYFPNLKVLSLAHNNIVKIYSNSFLVLEELLLNGNKLDKIEGLQAFPNLKRLDLQSNKIEKVQDLMPQLLERLNLNFNQIIEIENIEHLLNLKSLSFSHNLIKKIDELSNLQLYNLDLSGNNIEIIENLTNLENLKFLNLSFNKISKISGLNKLLNLKFINLHSNKINTIEGLDKLTDLSALFLGNNEIYELKGLSKLKNLHGLYLNRNLITRIEKIENLKSLSNLDLQSNRINKIDGISELKDLVFFNISHNLIEDLKDCEELLNSNVKELKIENNPFIEKNNIILDKNENHYDIIINEIKKYQATKIEIALPLKICLLGNHASGKSTFLNFFFTNKAKNDNSTHILDIRAFKSKKTENLPEAIFYDFGGQDYYHGIYKAFLTQTSTNLLFWNKSTDINELKLDSKGQKNINFNKKYWLGQINYIEELEGESSDNKNIYQIQTHSDIHPQEILQNKNTKRFIYLSFEEKSLHKDSYKLILQSFKEEISEIISNRPQKEISNDEYELYKFIINNKKINEVDIKDLLIHYNKSEDEINLLQAELDQLSKRGVILYYKNCKSLQNVAWLQPTKTVAEIYKVFNESILRRYQGEIPKEIFEKKIDNPNLLELLKYNKVIFLDEKSLPIRYIVPGYLQSTTDEGDDYFIFGDFNNFNFIFKFENFIPFGFINQLICKYGGKYEAKSFRKDQLIFTTQEKDVKVLIRLDFRKLLIKVGVISKVENKISKIEKKIFHEILLTYWAIDMDFSNNDFNYDISNYQKNFLSDNTDASNMDFNEKREYIKNLDMYTFVRSQSLKNNIAPEDMYLSVDSKNFVHYHTLENENLITSSISSYSLKENGDLIKNENSIPTIQFQNFSNNKNIKNMKKVFISYSHEDVIEKQRLMTFLKPLERSGKINIWQDLKLQAGVKVQQEILDKLDEADIIIMLVSQDFIGSDFIYDHELQNAMKKRIQNKVKILPIMISDCTIFDLDLYIDNDEDQKVKMGDYYFVPQDEKNNIKPIRLWKSHLQDSAWKKVYEALKKLIE